MLRLHASATGLSRRSRTAVAIVAATLLIGGSITEASARPRHHRHHHHHHHHSRHHVHHAKNRAHGSWLDANASIAPFHHAGRTFSGLASFYGNEAGHRTASGQRFNQNAMTCAHRSLPFGTRLRVSHAGRSVIVTVNDRGPFVRGRVLDLSKGAARVVGLTGRGVGRVVAEVL
jgi:rare lipoprotein A